MIHLTSSDVDLNDAISAVDPGAVFVSLGGPFAQHGRRPSSPFWNVVTGRLSLRCEVLQSRRNRPHRSLRTRRTEESGKPKPI